LLHAVESDYDKPLRRSSVEWRYFFSSNHVPAAERGQRLRAGFGGDSLEAFRVSDVANLNDDINLGALLERAVPG